MGKVLRLVKFVYVDEKGREGKIEDTTGKDPNMLFIPAAEYEKLWEALDEIDRDGPLTGEDAIGFREIARTALGR